MYPGSVLIIYAKSYTEEVHFRSSNRLLACVVYGQQRAEYRNRQQKKDHEWVGEVGIRPKNFSGIGVSLAHGVGRWR